MFTNGAPAQRIILLAVVALLILSNLGKAQQIYPLYPLGDYEASLKAYHTAKLNAACLEFQQRTKTKWWYYLPNIGIQFGFPSITAGTNQLVQIDQTKQQNRVKLAAIISQANLEYQGEIHKLRVLYTEAQLERDIVGELQTSFRLEDKILDIKKEAFEKKEMNPVEYYQALLNFQRTFSANNARYQVYNVKAIEVGHFARYDFPFSEVLPVPVAPGSGPKVSEASPDHQQN